MTTSTNQRARKKGKEGSSARRQDNSQDMSPISQDTSPNISDTIRQDTIYLLITGETEDSNLSVNSDAQQDPGDTMAGKLGNSERREEQTNRTVQKVSIPGGQGPVIADGTDSIQNVQSAN